MNIMFFIASATRCGPTNVAYGIVKYVKEVMPEIKIHLVTIKEGDRPDKVFIKKYTEKYYNLGGISLSSLSNLNKYIAINNIDIIHSHGLIADVYSGFTNNKKNAYRLTTLHCNLNEDYNSTYRWYKYYPYLAIHKMMLKRLDKVVGVSKNALRSINKLNINPTYIYNGVESNPSSVKPANGKVILLYIGVLNEIKNIYFLIDQMKKVSLLNMSIELHIYGKGELEEHLKVYAKDFDNVYFKGFVESPSEFYTLNSILVSSSYSEGLPMSVIEALGSGLPALLSNIKAHKEIKMVMNEGVELFDFDKQSFCIALNKILESLCDAEARDKIINNFNNHFSYKCMGEKYLKIYNSVNKH